MAVILEGTEEGNNNPDDTVTDQSIVLKESYTFDEMVHMLSKANDKEAEDDSASFLFA